MIHWPQILDGGTKELWNYSWWLVLLAPWNLEQFEGSRLHPQEWVGITEVKLTKYNDFSNDTLNIQILMLV